MPDSYTEKSAEESVVALHAKAEYENAINLSQHVPAAKIISEMVLDAFHTSKESDQIRELRVAIRQAHDAFDDDKAYELMGQLKQLKDAEAADNAALEHLSSQFSISRILSSFKDDPEFQELVYGLALKVLNQSHQAISNPSAGKGKAARAKKDTEVFVISKDGISVTLPLRTPRSSSTWTARRWNSWASPLWAKAARRSLRAKPSSTTAAPSSRSRARAS